MPHIHPDRPIPGESTRRRRIEAVQREVHAEQQAKIYEGKAPSRGRSPKSRRQFMRGSVTEAEIRRRVEQRPDRTTAEKEGRVQHVLYEKRAKRARAYFHKLHSNNYGRADAEFEAWRRNPDGEQRRCLQSGEYYTCLTNSQWAKLFGRTRKYPKKLGCGSYACVYPSRDKSKVIKLTTDPGDVHTTRAAQGLPGAVTLYNAYHLHGGSGYSYEKRYAMVLEKLYPIPREHVLDAEIGEALHCAVRRAVTPTPKACCEEVRPGKVVGWESGGTGWGKRKRAIRKQMPARPTCLKLVKMAIEMKEGLRARNLQFTDWHPGNVGRDRKGNWKVLDLGYNVNYVRPLPKELRGVR